MELPNEDAKENMRDIFENLLATRGKEFAQTVMLACRARASAELIRNSQFVHAWQHARTYESAASTLDELVSTLVDVHSLDPNEIKQWADIVMTKSGLPVTR